MAEEKAGEARFAFGENWLSFVNRLDADRVAEAEKSVAALCGDLRDKTFLDIGSGSGLSSLAAHRLGARVHSFDYDPNSVAATSGLSNGAWTVQQGSILDSGYVASLGQYDVVYSWGVLHHTGDMRKAIANAANLVANDGLLVLALYRKTLLCPLWKVEKQFYIKSSASAQRAIRSAYIALYRAGLAAKGRSFKTFVDDYKLKRGMDFEHDVHDWLGGYPYESISPSDANNLVVPLGFMAVKSRIDGFHIGLFGSGCDEFVFRRQ